MIMLYLFKVMYNSSHYYTSTAVKHVISMDGVSKSASSMLRWSMPSIQYSMIVAFKVCFPFRSMCSRKGIQWAKLLFDMFSTENKEGDN